MGMSLVWVAVFCMIAELNAVSRCINAPTQAKRIFCEQLHRWDAGARALPPVAAAPPLPPAIEESEMRLIAGGFAPIAATPYQCKDLACLCSYLRGKWQPGWNTCTLPNGQQLMKAVRREYRTLSNEERQRLHTAFRAIKESGEYDKLATVYSQHGKSGGAHSGPAFLPWHREFLKRLEIALRLADAEVSLPYWDSTLDSLLADPKDSILWTDELMGSTDENGTVQGDFSNWKVPQGRRMLRREVGTHGSPLTKHDIDYIMSMTSADDILAFTAPRQGCYYRTDYNALEYAQGGVQVFVGGDMLDIATAANDPVFYLHHAFVDFLWEQWRQQRQAALTKHERQNSYPPDMQLCSSGSHFGSAFMRPFEPLRNIDGLSSSYTDFLYDYAPRPSCEDGPSCGSKYLFCDHSRLPARCVSKVKPGGNCTGFHRGEAVCYRGRCVDGTCVADSITFPSTRSPVVTNRIIPVLNNCYNEHECCSTWAARGECTRNKSYMNLWCKASCHICRPTFNIALECADFHRKCIQWSRSGECSKNPLWMAENCRKSCARCAATRAQICNGGKQPPTTTSPAPAYLEKCASPGCYNENICCPLWGLQGQCTTNATYMSCYCRVSCGLCIPRDYFYGTCKNYHRRCEEWASRGECEKSAWMLENCRESCGSCFTQTQLKPKCRIGSGKLVVTRKAKQLFLPTVDEIPIGAA
uniref:ShTK domain protein n=1 Tax=Ascaris lumbricoides TaxID=6252 RepID=A0A0M3IJ33_ASCLU